MSKVKPKFYVVWSGKKPGVYNTWDECKEQVIGVAASRYKSFGTYEEACKAYAEGPGELKRATGKKVASKMASSEKTASASSEIIKDAWAVDAACSGNPGMMEYRGVDVKMFLELGGHQAKNQENILQIFHYGPVFGTNNIGEFLAIVHALALQKKNGTRYPIYSDSRNAQLWVKNKKCKTTLVRNEKTALIYDRIARAEYWLQTNNFDDIKILKWDTKRWGEIPADFGRK